MRPALSALVCALALAGCGEKAAPPQPDHITIADAVIRLPAADGRPAAGYFTLRGGKEPDRLVSISSPSATTIELHESRMSGGVMSMRALTGVDVPARGTVRFAPGGNHAMLFGIDPAVRPGMPIKLSFSFQEGKAVEIEATTIGAGAAMPEAAAEHEGH